MSGAPDPSPIYLGSSQEAVFGFFHPAAHDRPGQSAVLLCPPFGWEDVCSYRSRREWAMHLAEDGHPTLRIDLPGTGDSGGGADGPDRLQAWTDGVSAAAGWLAEIDGVARVAAIGIGLSGLVICRALAAGAPIDELVLWAVPARGRALVRELRAFTRLEESLFAIPDEPATVELPEGALAAGGFLLGAETARALEQLDVSALEVPPARARRVLLLDRDGIELDPRLREHFQATGAVVTEAAGEGYGAMMAEPQDARPPLAVFATLDSWLGEGSPASPSPSLPSHPPASPAPPRGSERHDAIELTIAGRRIRETPLSIEQPCGRIFGILAEPLEQAPSELCVVLLNAGAVRRIGPNRLWVTLARRWAARGVPTLRLDLEGIGDADGDAGRLTELSAFHVPELVEQVRAAVDELQRRGLGTRFALGGLCSGAYWSFHAALRDERVVAAFMLNPRALFWDPALETMRDLRRGLRSSSRRKLLRGKVSPAEVGSIVREAPRALATRSRQSLTRRRTRARGGDELDRALDQLGAANKRLLFAFSKEEPLHEELLREGRLGQAGRWPNIELQYLPGRHHTLRSIEAQQRAIEVFDEALGRELALEDRLAQQRGAGEPRIADALE